MTTMLVLCGLVLECTCGKVVEGNDGGDLVIPWDMSSTFTPVLGRSFYMVCTFPENFANQIDIMFKNIAMVRCNAGVTECGEPADEALKAFFNSKTSLLIILENFQNNLEGAWTCRDPKNGNSNATIHVESSNITDVQYSTHDDAELKFHYETTSSVLLQFTKKQTNKAVISYNINSKMCHYGPDYTSSKVELQLLDNQASSLILKDLVIDDGGTYYVEVTYDFANKTNTYRDQIYLKVKALPNVEVESAGFDYWIIAVILGIIFVIIVIFLIVCKIRYNRGGDYPAAGHDPERELKDLSRADGIDDDRLAMDRMSLDASLKCYERDEDDLREYGC